MDLDEHMKQACGIAFAHDLGPYHDHITGPHFGRRTCKRCGETVTDYPQ